MSGSGFVVFNEDTINSKQPKMLALIRSDGVFDIPKGHNDKGESSMQAAKRECFEECSIMVNDHDIMHSVFVNGPLSVFCCKTSQTPMISKNPQSGILEHTGYKWVTKEEFLANCLNFLVPAVQHFYSVHSAPYNP